MGGKAAQGGEASARVRARERERERAMSSDTMTVKDGEQSKGYATNLIKKYCTNLRASVETDVNASPRAFVHSRECMKIMTVDEWSARWKRNEDFPDCLACGSLNTKEHHFIQTWCRGNRKWESETLCLDCHNYSWRSYRDPEFTTPSEHEKERWNKMLEQNKALGVET